MWLVSGAPEDAVDDTVMEVHCTEALYWVAKSLIHGIQTEDNTAQ